MTLPIIISGYSSDEYYEKAAARFESMVKPLENKYIIEKFESAGDWHSNTRKKPEIILKLLEQEKTSVIWIDADADVYKSVKINIPEDIDMMGIKQEWGPRRAWCVGTLLFNYTENSINMLKDWVQSCQNGSGTDEAHLELVWNAKWKTILKTKILDPKFFVINKIHVRDYNTVILHKSSGNARRGNLK